MHIATKKQRQSVKDVILLVFVTNVSKNTTFFMMLFGSTQS